MGRTYRHLTLRERPLFFRMLDKKASIRAIAEKLGKHISTIYREIKRSWFDDMDPWLDGYYGEAADQMARIRGLGQLAPKVIFANPKPPGKKGLTRTPIIGCSDFSPANLILRPPLMRSCKPLPTR